MTPQEELQDALLGAIQVALHKGLTAAQVNKCLEFAELPDEPDPNYYPEEIVLER